MTKKSGFADGLEIGSFIAKVSLSKKCQENRRHSNRPHASTLSLCQFNLDTFLLRAGNASAPSNLSI